MRCEDSIPTGPPPSNLLFPGSCSRAASLTRRKIKLPGSNETTGQWEVMIKGGTYQIPGALRMNIEGWTRTQALSLDEDVKESPSSRNRDIKVVTIDLLSAHFTI